MSTTARLFVALWPGEAVRRRLVAHRDSWLWPGDARPVADANLHATLHFIGAFARDRIDALVAALSDVPSRQPVSLEPRGTAVWPGGIAVLTLHATPALAGLHGRIGAALADLGIALDARPFAPHVTLARRATGATAPGALPDVAWRSGAVALVESRPGQPYCVLATFG